MIPKNEINNPYQSNQTPSNEHIMTKLIKPRNLILVNFTIIAFFIMIWLLNIYKIDGVVIGIFREFFTLPFLIAQLVVVVIGTKYVLNHQTSFLTLVSVICLAICTLITIGSFF